MRDGQRHQIAAGIERQFGIQAGRDGDGALRREQQVVAISRQLHELRGTDIATGPTAILHHHIDTQNGRQLLRQHACRYIGATTGRKRREKGDAPRRVALRHRQHRRQDQQQHREKFHK